MFEQKKGREERGSQENRTNQQEKTGMGHNNIYL